MSPKVQFVIPTALTIVFGVPGWAALFLDHPDALDGLIGAMRPALDVAYPIVMTLLGAFAGYKLCAWLGKRSDVSRLESELSVEKEKNDRLLSELAAVEGKHAKKVDDLSRKFSGMTQRRKAIVTLALDEGAASLSSLDQDALTLCQLGILGLPPIVARTSNVDFSVQPCVITEIREHRNEWLDGMDADTARTILSKGRDSGKDIHVLGKAVSYTAPDGWRV